MTNALTVRSRFRAATAAWIARSRASASAKVMCQMVRLEIVRDNLDVVQFRSSFGSHSTVSQCLRASMALRVSLLTWIGPLSSTSTTVLLPSWLRTEQVVELLEVSDEVAGCAWSGSYAQSTGA